jgi:hypothetical protein
LSTSVRAENFECQHCEAKKVYGKNTMHGATISGRRNQYEESLEMIAASKFAKLSQSSHQLDSSIKTRQKKLDKHRRADGDALEHGLSARVKPNIGV